MTSTTNHYVIKLDGISGESPNTIQKGSWCPDCASLERITSAKSKVRRTYQAKGDGEPG